MGHGVKDCGEITVEEKEKPVSDFPYFVSLRVESQFVGKENFQINLLLKKASSLCVYIGKDEGDRPAHLKSSVIVTSKIGEYCGPRECARTVAVINKATDFPNIRR